VDGLHTQDQRAGPGGRARRAAITAWAAILSGFFGLVFVATTALSIGTWLTDPGYTETNPVVDLGFFALGAVLIGAGFAMQLRAPEGNIAGVQQAVVALLALGVAGLIGGRIEPLTGAVVFLAATAVLVALHPARREFLKPGAGLSGPLAALALLAAVPAAGFASTMLRLARRAGPSCFLGRCAHGDRFAEMVALVGAVVLVGLLASLRTRGWRVSAWSAAVAAVIVGAASFALPDAPGSLGQGWGTVAVAWGVLFAAVAAWEARRGQRGGRRVLIEGEIDIDRPVEEVFDLVADERNEPRYNPRMRRAEKITEGPIGVGTRYRAETVSMGRAAPMVIEVTDYDRPRLLASMTHLSSMEIRYTLTFEAAPEGTRMRWSGDLEPRGILKLMGPLVALMGRRQERRIWTALKHFLEAGEST